METKGIILVGMTIMCCLWACGSCESSDVYIDPGVDSSGDGSIEAPYKYWADVAFESGHAYVQKRDTIAYESIKVGQSGTPSERIVLGAYGSGADPIIYGAESETNWVDAGVAGKKVYQKAISLAVGEGLGNVSEDGNLLAFVAWNTDAATTFVSATAGAYTYDYRTQTVYIWSSDGADPDAHTIEVSKKLFGVHGEGISYITVRDLHIKRASLHGILFKNSSHITVKNCTIEDLGGAVVIVSPTIYAGNGIEFGNACSDCIVESCTVRNCFDSGISPQTYANDMNTSGFVFRDSRVERCGFAGIEIAVLSVGMNCSITDVLVSNNVISDCGAGWSGIRYGDGGRGIKVAADAGSGTIRGVQMEQNTISNCMGSGIYLYGDIGQISIHRSSLHDNKLDGIEALDDANPSSLALALSSSLIYNNGSNNGANDRFGVSHNIPYGAGMQLYHNTFHDNGSINVAIWNTGGVVTAKNNVYHTSGTTTHFYSNVDLPGADIDNNCYYEHGGAIIHVNGSAGSPYATVKAFKDNTTFAENGIGTANPGLDIDFTLMAGSRCIGNGATGTGIAEDHAGKTFSVPPSIGAYEY
ncbi:right-handed parallel beta-helix repeat-containing protein [Candidatus Poribacteria bacterium]